VPAARLPLRAIAVASLVVIVMFAGPIGRWPWDHDEVQSLMELRVVPLDRYPGPPAQMERMARLIPLWNAIQGTALKLLPANEWGTRLLPSLFGAFVVIISLLAAFRWRGTWFGWSILTIMAGSQTLVWLSQQNRFYSLALLWTALAFVAIAIEDDRFIYDALAGVFAMAAVLSHNLTLVVFGLCAVAGAIAWLMRWISTPAARRLVIAASLTSVLYLLYVRPLLGSWISGGTGGTSPVVSFVAQVGIAPMALAAFGCWHALTNRAEGWLRWWVLVLVLDAAFIATSPWTLKNWNPRYALFFMPPVWVLAAAGTALIAESLRPQLRAVWILAVLALLLPKLGSHFIDGSRHDFRSAAEIIARQAPAADVMSDWPGELQYYLQPLTGQKARYLEPVLPDTPLVVALGTNAWEPPLSVPGRTVHLLGQVARRRFDEQSHVVRVYLLDRK